MKLVNLSVLDIDSLLELESEFSDGYSLSQLRSAFSSGRFYCLGIKEREKLIGFVCYSIAMEQADIETVFVKAEYRRLGLAKRLIESAQEQMVKQGAIKSFLEVRNSNLPARALYQGLGYTEISVRKKYYPDDEDAVIMAKDLV